MFCFVDFRNRPQYKYAFSSRERAQEHLQKIQNNPLGATVIHADGRREYFAGGLSASLMNSRANFRILKGCHVKYKIRPLSVLDGIAPARRKKNSSNPANWKTRKASPLFMLGNLKFSTCLIVVSLIAFSSSYFLQKNLGQTASAGPARIASQSDAGGQTTGQVLGAADSKVDEQNSESDLALNIADEDVILNLIGKIDDERHEDFKQEILQYIKGRPMEAMAPAIAKQPRIVAAFLVGIAMKESKFGTYAPHLDGRDCRNYWGFKGGGETAAGGYTCFSSPEEAIQVVGRRIERLVDGGRTNPAEMVVWKCGFSCSWDNPENVRKWIADVGINFYRINNGKENS